MTNTALKDDVDKHVCPLPSAYGLSSRANINS